MIVATLRHRGFVYTIRLSPDGDVDVQSGSVAFAGMYQHGMFDCESCPDVKLFHRIEERLATMSGDPNAEGT